MEVMIRKSRQEGRIGLLSGAERNTRGEARLTSRQSLLTTCGLRGLTGNNTSGFILLGSDLILQLEARKGKLYGDPIFVYTKQKQSSAVFVFLEK